MKIIHPKHGRGHYRQGNLYNSGKKECRIAAKAWGALVAWLGEMPKNWNLVSLKSVRSPFGQEMSNIIATPGCGPVPKNLTISFTPKTPAALRGPTAAGGEGGGGGGGRERETLLRISARGFSGWRAPDRPTASPSHPREPSVPTGAGRGAHPEKGGGREGERDLSRHSAGSSWLNAAGGQERSRSWERPSPTLQRARARREEAGWFERGRAVCGRRLLRSLGRAHQDACRSSARAACLGEDSARAGVFFFPLSLFAHPPPAAFPPAPPLRCLVTRAEETTAV